MLLLILLLKIIEISSYTNTFPTHLTYENNGIFYWKIGKSRDYQEGKMKYIIFNNYPILVTRSYDKNISAISDICIHRGASLSKGKILNKGCIQCPYHGWEYKNNGKLEKIPGEPSIKTEKMGVPQFLTKELDGNVYLCPSYDKTTKKGLKPLNDPLRVPEESDNKFVRQSGKIKINIPNQLVTENVLDMMHISYVHSFGNRLSPVPFDLHYEDIDELSGRTTFFYTAGPSSISSLFAKAEFVKVENEFYLPDTTVTRVYANDYIKTIVTYCYPINNKESIFHYDLYRNFLTEPIFNKLFEYQMDLTLKEDMGILNNLHEGYTKGFINTKYDITQMKYRKKIKEINKLMNEKDQ